MIDGSGRTTILEAGQHNQEAKGANRELISDKPAQAVIGVGAYQDVITEDDTQSGPCVLESVAC